MGAVCDRPLAKALIAEMNLSASALDLLPKELEGTLGGPIVSDWAYGFVPGATIFGANANYTIEQSIATMVRMADYAS